MVLWQIFLAFTRANLLGYGGGPAVIPLIEAESVGTYGWLTKEEFGDALAISNALPGPIATKMSTFIGYKVAGIAGAVVALLGTVLPTAILILALFGLLMRYKEVPAVQGMIKAVRPVVFVLFLLLAIDFAKFAWPPTSGWFSALIAIAAFIGIYHFKVHQAVAIFAAILIGALFFR